MTDLPETIMFCGVELKHDSHYLAHSEFVRYAVRDMEVSRTRMGNSYVWSAWVHVHGVLAGSTNKDPHDLTATLQSAETAVRDVLRRLEHLQAWARAKDAQP